MKYEHQIGKHGEQTARSVLHGLGLEMIEKVGTPVRLIPVRGQQPGVYKVIFGEKVAADYRAMFPDGRSVLIEIKTIYDRNLIWSDLREHQPGKLQEHAQFNGLSLLVWVHDTGVYVMSWPVNGFRPGKGITPAAAAIHHEATVQYIQRHVARIRDELAELEKECLS